MLMAVQAGISPWPETAIRDTIAEIARQSVYQRTLGETLWARVMDWAAGIIRWLFNLFAGSDNGRVIVTVLFGLLVVVIFARLIIGLRENSDGQRVSKIHTDRHRGRDPLHAAEQYAATGDFVAAAHALCAAVLDACAARGELRLHPSKTTGDYARELRRKRMPSMSAFQTFRLRYDGLVYGTAAFDEREYHELRSLVAPVLTRERAA